MATLTINVKQPIETVKIGATPAEGGTRSSVVTIGGQKCMPFTFAQDEPENKPVVAYEIWDTPPADWPATLANELKIAWGDSFEWANYIINKTRAEILFLRLMSLHPHYNNRTVKEAVEFVRQFLVKIKLPVIIVGCGVTETDDEVIPLAAEALRGERLLFGNVTADNYKKIIEACVKYGHSVITESPIDINLAKQANILADQAGLPKDRIVMYATTGALGYGLEYAYSVMEQTRIYGLEGDRHMNKPQIAFVGQESWRSKEAKESREAGITWEEITAEAYLHCGADIVIVRHPESGRRIEEFLSAFFKN